MGRRTEDLVGKTFGWLTVKERLPNLHDGNVIYNCQCECGNLVVKRGQSLRRGTTHLSCGCRRPRKNVVNVKHGYARAGNRQDPRYRLWQSARYRAKLKGTPFELTIEDIVIPEFCPVFPSIRLQQNHRPNQDSSPSLDAVIPSLGYVKGNVVVMSLRANRLKNDGNALEHRRIADWIDSHLRLNS